MNRTVAALACAILSAAALAEPVQKARKNHVPERLDDIRLITPLAATRNHILAVNVGGAIPEKDWVLAVTYASSRLQLNVWTNSIGKTLFPEVAEKPSAITDAFGKKAKVAVFLEDSDSPYPYLSAPGAWCRVNVRYLKSDKPDLQTMRDRYAKAILKGFVYACGSGAALDGRSASNFDTFTLAGMDKTNITISPDSYFPMLEVLRVIGGNEILSPAVAEGEED